MGIILPLLNFFVLFLIFLHRPLPVKGDWRHSFIFASIAWGIIALFALELLSPLSAVTFSGLGIFWTCTLCALTLLARRLDVKFNLPLSFRESVLKWDNVPLYGTCFILLMVGFIALKAPPNNYDSMTYHMSRVAHWVQNRSIALYPTNIIRQDTYTPWAEYAILHFQILNDGDRFANCIQWFSMLGSIIGTSAIARQLGAGPQGQVLAAALTASLPMGILQGSSTQTDYVTAFWLVCVVYSGLLLLTHQQWRYALWVGAGLGLAALTKGTSYFFSLPFIFLVLIGLWKAYRPNALKAAAIIVLIPLLLNSGFYARNLQMQKSLLSKQEHTEISNQAMNPALLISNIVKNLSLHWGTPFEAVNMATEKAIYALHDAMGLSTSDARISWDPDGELHVGEMSSHEDNAGNLFHFIINVIAMVILGTRLIRGPRLPQVTVWYFVALLSGFILFNIYMKWAPWHSRYHLPLFVLFAPITAVIISSTAPRKIITALSIFFILAAMPWVWGNKTRAFFKKKNVFNHPRLEQYFYNKPGLSFSFQKAVAEAAAIGCTEIGFITSPDGWEYPYWPILKSTFPSFRLEHVAVTNASKDMPYPLGPFSPCVIFEHRGDISKLTLNGKTYVRVREFAYANVFLEDKDGSLAARSLAYNFNKLLSEAQKLYLFIAQHSLSSLTKEQTQTLIELLKAQRTNAGHLDMDALNKSYPLLGNNLTNGFVRGVDEMLAGLSSGDPAKTSDGFRALAAWNIWLEKHINGIKEALDKLHLPK